MHIGIDLRDLSTSVVGVGRATLNVLDYIAGHDTENEYVFYQCADDDYSAVQKCTKKVVPLAPYSFMQEQMYFSARCLFDRLDIFHAPIHVPPLQVPQRTKIVFTVHDIHSELDPALFPPDMNRYFSHHRKKGIERADAVLVDTQYVKGRILELTPVDEQKIHVVPLGVLPAYTQTYSPEALDTTKRKYDLPEQFVLYVGSIEPWKRVVELIQEFLRFEKGKKENIHLVLAGRPGWKQDVCDQVTALCDEHTNIHWLRYVPQEDLPLIYRCATVFATASKWEGFGLILLEAMASGVPIIAAANACIPEVVGNAGLLFNPEEEQDFGRQLGRLLSDNTLCEQLKQKGLERVKQFDYTTYGREVLNVYQNVSMN